MVNLTKYEYVSNLNYAMKKESTILIKQTVVNLCKELNMPIPSKAQTLGRLGELIYYKKLEDGPVEFDAPCLYDSFSPFDFLVNNKRIEVKASLKGKNDRYTFVFIKNIGKFDKLVCLLLEKIDSPPMILEFNPDTLSKFKGGGVAGDYKYLRNLADNIKSNSIKTAS